MCLFHEFLIISIDMLLSILQRPYSATFLAVYFPQRKLSGVYKCTSSKFTDTQIKQLVIKEYHEYARPATFSGCI